MQIGNKEIGMNTDTAEQHEIKSLLVISFFDFQAQHGRIHHLIDYLKERIPRVTVLHRINRLSPGIGRKLKTLFLLSTEQYHIENVTYFACDPFLNIPERITEDYYVVRDENFTVRNRIMIRLQNLFNIITLPKEYILIFSFFMSFLINIRKRFDLCIVQSPWEAAVAYLLHRFGFIGTLVYDDMDYAPGHIPSKLRRRYQQWEENLYIKRADAVFSVGYLLGERRRKETGRKIIVIPNGVDHPLFRQAQEKKAHPPTLVYVGRLSADWGGIDVILRAVKKLVGEIPDLLFIMIGGGFPHFIKQIEKEVRELEISRNIKIVGKVSYAEIPEYLRSCDIGLACFKPNLIRTYCFPLKVVEYMAAGLAVLGTKETETEALIERCECGVSVHFDADMIFQAVRKIFTEESLLQRFQTNAVHHSKQFDWDVLLDKEYRIIRDMHQKKPGPQRPGVQ